MITLKRKESENFYAFTEATCVNKELDPKTVVRGKHHDYLGVLLCFNGERLAGIDTNYHIQAIKGKFPEKENRVVRRP